jgi:transmembrane sensor
VYRQSAAEIEKQASHWVFRLDHEGHSPVLQMELDAWLAGDARRRGALLQAEAAWAMLDVLAAPQNEPCQMTSRHEIKFSRRSMIAGGAAIAASAVAGLSFLWSLNRYQTRVGEIRRVPLPDGSTAAINTASAVEVHMASDARNITLAYGEAWFQVAKDPARPFTVKAGPVRVTAVGTAFSVYRRTADAEVMVTEGVVEAWVEGARGAGIRLAAGERALISDDAAVTKRPVQPSEVDRALAWRSGTIDLSGSTLAAAAAEFNRYNRRQLIIADEGLGGERFYGVFRIEDADGFANAVEQSLRVKVSFADPSIIVIGDSKKKM